MLSKDTLVFVEVCQLEMELAHFWLPLSVALVEGAYSAEGFICANIGLQFVKLVLLAFVLLRASLPNYIDIAVFVHVGRDL